MNDHPASFFFQGNREPQPDALADLPPPPAWRDFARRGVGERGRSYLVSDEEVRAVNAALYLRRPLLVAGKPGVGKSSLAYAVAHELGLGEVLVWPITSRSTLQQGIYNYDAIRRLEETALRREAGAQASDGSPSIESFLRLGPLGTALLASKEKHPRVLLIDEIDKSDIDLPNDLLHVFEEGRYEIRELSRMAKAANYEKLDIPLDGGGTGEIIGGMIRCEAFPFIVLTSNGEREFPPAFQRRCLRLDVVQPDVKALAEIVARHLESSPEAAGAIQKLIDDFVDLRDRQKRELATDQLLNAAYLIAKGRLPDGADLDRMKSLILRPLGENAA